MEPWPATFRSGLFTCTTSRSMTQERTAAHSTAPSSYRRTNKLWWWRRRWSWVWSLWVRNGTAVLKNKHTEISLSYGATGNKNSWSLIEIKCRCQTSLIWCFCANNFTWRDLLRVFGKLRQPDLSWSQWRWLIIQRLCPPQRHRSWRRWFLRSWCTCWSSSCSCGSSGSWFTATRRRRRSRKPGRHGKPSRRRQSEWSACKHVCIFTDEFQRRRMCFSLSVSPNGFGPRLSQRWKTHCFSNVSPIMITSLSRLWTQFWPPTRLSKCIKSGTQDFCGETKFSVLFCANLHYTTLSMLSAVLIVFI